MIRTIHAALSTGLTLEACAMWCNGLIIDGKPAAAASAEGM